jgi:two-component system chemotaxis response regulator CheY
MRALVVDDSRAMRKIVTGMLRTLGADCHEAGDGLEGIGVLRRVGPVDLVLTDLHMPEMDGIELVKAVRAEPSWERTVVCLLSSDADTSQIARALMAGADEYLMKPITIEALEDFAARSGLATSAQ